MELDLQKCDILTHTVVHYRLGHVKYGLELAESVIYSLIPYSNMDLDMRNTDLDLRKV